MKPYAVFVSREAMQLLVQTSGIRRRSLLNFLERLADNPFQAGEFQVQDIHDRSCEVKHVGRWLVTYHADHAVREVQVLDLQLL